MPGINYKLGSFATNGSPGTQVVTGVGFQPKALIVFANIKTTDGNAVDYYMGAGIATGNSSQGCICANDVDNVDPTDSGSLKYNNQIHSLFDERSNLEYGPASLTSLDSDGFTLEWTAGSGVVLNYIALGGDRLSAFMGKQTVPTGTGNVSYTGIGFQPDCVLFLFNGINQADTVANGGYFMMSFADRINSTKGVMALATGDNVSGGNDGIAVLLATTAFRWHTEGTGTVKYNATVNSWDSDGFTLNWSTVGVSTTNEFFFLALKGVQAKLASFNESNSAGTVAYTGVGFSPELLMFLSRGQSGPASFARNMIGAARSSSERAVIWAGQN